MQAKLEFLVSSLAWFSVGTTQRRTTGYNKIWFIKQIDLKSQFNKRGVKMFEGGKKEGGQYRACACVRVAGTKEGDKGGEEERVYVSTRDE